MSFLGRHVGATLLGTLVLSSLVFVVAAPPPPVPIVYPEAPRGTVADDFHSTKVTDPYRWLEDLDAPATRAWVAGEKALTEAYVGGLPARDTLRRRLGKLYDFERFGLPFATERRYFYTHNTGLQNQSVHFKTEHSYHDPWSPERRCRPRHWRALRRPLCSQFLRGRRS